jgi:hypothetical protein
VKLSIFIAVTALVVVVATLYGLRQEIERQTEGLVKLTSQRQITQLKSYYRAHQLPVGWKIGEITEDTGCIRVSIYFLPSINSKRYGETADTAEITQQTGCPQAPDVWAKLGDRKLCLALHDRTGLIEELRCQVPPSSAAR